MKNTSEQVKSEVLVYSFNNPDGTLRWRWPIKARRPLFLKFYNPTTYKQKLFSALIKVIFRFNFQSFIFKKSNLSDQNIGSEYWASFNCTLGPNNKKIYFFCSPNKPKKKGF